MVHQVVIEMLGNCDWIASLFRNGQHLVASVTEVSVGSSQATCLSTCSRLHRLFCTCHPFFSAESLINKRIRLGPKRTQDLNTPLESRKNDKTRVDRSLLSESSPQHHPLLLLSPDDHPRSSPLRPLNSPGTLGLCNLISISIDLKVVCLTFPLGLRYFFSYPTWDNCRPSLPWPQPSLRVQSNTAQRNSLGAG